MAHLFSNSYSILFYADTLVYARPLTKVFLTPIKN